MAEPVEALKYIPPSAGLVISGSHLENLGNSNLGKLWTQAKTAVSGSGTDVISRLVQPLTDVEKSRGINLEQDIFSWIKGEYAIALVPHAGQIIPDWIFVTEKLANLPEGIARLDAIASSQGLSNNTITIDQQAVSVWTKLTTVTPQTDGKNKPSLQ